MKAKNLWMFVAILICGAMMMLTSCSENDNPLDNNKLASQLVGEWIMEHNMDRVELFVQGNNIQIPADADMFTSIYHFDADSSGWNELVIMKDGKCIVSVISRYGEGEFTYTIDKNGKVLVNYIDEETCDELTFDGQSLTTLIRGQQFNFVRATKEQIEKYKAEADAIHGGSDEQTATGHALTSAAVGEIVGSDGKAYAGTDYNILPSGVTAVAMIAYVGSESDCAHGLAIALENENGAMDWWDANEFCSSKTAVTGGTWRLPSIKDWQYMFIGCGASGSYSDNPSIMSCSELVSKLSAAQGIVLENDFFYWSSTKTGTDYWGLYIDGDDAEFRKQDDGNGLHARACLAF